MGIESSPSNIGDKLVWSKVRTASDPLKLRMAAWPVTKSAIIFYRFNEKKILDSLTDLVLTQHANSL